MALLLQEEIGKGGYARVYRALDVDLDRPVAVKILSRSLPDAVNARQHAQALARVDHPNVVKVFRLDTIDDPLDGLPADAIVMELIEGMTLMEEVEAHTLPVDMVRNTGLDVLSAVEAMHEAGLAHRDLHARNVMLGARGVKVIDILYSSLDTLSLLSSGSREDRLAEDRRKLHTLLTLALNGSDVAPDRIAAFSAADPTSISAIRAAFQTAVDSTAPMEQTRLLLLQAYDRLTEKGFAPSLEYATALAAQTDRDIDAPLLVMLVEGSAFRDDQRYFVRTLWERMNEEERARVITALSVAINSQVPNGIFHPHLRFLRWLDRSGWEALPVTTRLRLEHLIVQDIQNGLRSAFNSVTYLGGALAPYANAFGRFFPNRDALISTITQRLSSRWDEQNFVGEHFMPLIPQLADTPERRALLIGALQEAVRQDARVVVNNLRKLPADWQEEVRPGAMRDSIDLD